MTAQDYEAGWWGDCSNTYGEETKQLAYAHYMGLDLRDRGGPGPTILTQGARLLDLGGGPASMLLKVQGARCRTVVDPLPVPSWVIQRYTAAGVAHCQHAAEGWPGTTGFDLPYDETWIYNVLQHVEYPEEVILTAKRHSRYLRLFEWVDVPAHEGHPHELTVLDLERWIGSAGRVLDVNLHGAVGRAFVYTGGI